MPDSHSAGSPLNVVPVPPPHRPRWHWALRAILVILLLDLLGCNILVVILAVAQSLSAMEESDLHVRERHYSGKALGIDKVAIVHIDGVLMEGLTTFAQHQIEFAAGDNAVKAVVVRITSPGGTITASDDLHHRLTELRDGNPEKKSLAKPIIVSMGSIAASGGYYIAMPARTLFAEQTTITASIGVYAALPNLTELGDKVGFHMQIIKAGEIKDSGSPFKKMTEKEQQEWQDMVDQSYLQFLQIVEQGRPQLKGKLQEDIAIDKTVPVRDDKTREKKLKMTRYRADGGIFMAQDAKKYGLIDQIGYLEDAVKAAKQAANLSADATVVNYERPLTIMAALLGIKAQPPAIQLDARRLSSATTPRLWYLSPQADLAGLFSAAGQ